MREAPVEKEASKPIQGLSQKKTLRTDALDLTPA
jgi:hypothetical protein